MSDGANPADTSAGAGPQGGADGGNAGGEGTQPNTQGQPNGGTQPNTQQATQEVVYEFKTPDGIELDKASVDEFKAIAKDLKLPADAAQKVVDLAVKREAANREAHKTMVKGWAEEVQNDKELGGDKLDQTLATCAKAINLGPPELKELLNNSGLGNHPAVVKWAFAIGKALSEDRFVAAQGGQTKPQGGAENRLYDKTPATA